MVSWAGLRGAVPIILASYVLASGISRASEIFNLVFFVTFVSVLLQGTTIPAVAKWLRVDLPFHEKFRFPIEFNPTRDLKGQMLEIAVPAGARSAGKSLIELGLPKNVLVVLLRRGDDIFVPRGGTRIELQDTLLVVAENETEDSVRKLLI
jgi:cell volume regulation protein A